MLKKIRNEYPIIKINEAVKTGKIDRNEIKEKKGFLRQVIEAVYLFIQSCLDTDITGVSAQMAFIILLALLPTLFFIFLICSGLISNFDKYFFDIINMAVPEASSSYLTTEFNSLLSYLKTYRIILFSLSALMGTLSAHTIVIGLNKTYGFRNYKSKKWEWIKSFLMLLALVFILISALYLYFISTFTIENINDSIHLSMRESDVIQLTSYTSGILGLFLILLGIYSLTPYRRISLLEALPGSIFALISIVIIFQIYVKILNNSLNYLTIYGTMSGLFILLTALFFLSLMINLGAKVNVFFAKKTH